MNHIQFFFIACSCGSAVLGLIAFMRNDRVRDWGYKETFIKGIHWFYVSVIFAILSVLMF